MKPRYVRDVIDQILPHIDREDTMGDLLYLALEELHHSIFVEVPEANGHLWRKFFHTLLRYLPNELPLNEWQAEVVRIANNKPMEPRTAYPDKHPSILPTPNEKAG